MDRIDEDHDRFFSVHFGVNKDDKIIALITKLLTCIEFNYSIWSNWTKVCKNIAIFSYDSIIIILRS